MDKVWTAIIVAVVILLVVTLMVVGWRRRKSRQSALGDSPAVPTDLAPATAELEVLHVATTRGGDPWDRIAVGGLGFRARGLVAVHDGAGPRGILLRLDGTAPRWIPADRTRGVDRASWTIDRGVEPDGLVRLAWTMAGADVDTYLRADEPLPLLRALQTLIPASHSEEPA